MTDDSELSQRIVLLIGDRENTNKTGGCLEILVKNRFW